MDEPKGRAADLADITVPRPAQPKIILIAESPSAALLPIYGVSRTFPPDAARHMLFAAGEPGRLLVRVDNFLREMGDAQREEKVGQLAKIFHYGHLVYLHRTLPENALERQRGAELARREVDELLAQGAHVIVALGENAQDWLRVNYPPESMMEVLLPIPSNHVSSWYPSFLERMHRERSAATLGIRDAMAVQIDKLIRACAEL